jgi:hypothetical protein
MSARARALSLLGLLAVTGHASIAHAGGDAIKATIRDFRRSGMYEATFTVVASNSRQYFSTVTDLDGEHVAVHQCHSLRVVAQYPRLKWWWYDYLNGHTTRQAQANALDVLQAAHGTGDKVAFGYMGTGWSDAMDGEPCTVTSHALEELRENPIDGTTTAVLSYYKAP